MGNGCEFLFRSCETKTLKAPRKRMRVVSVEYRKSLTGKSMTIWFERKVEKKAEQKGRTTQR